MVTAIVVIVIITALVFDFTNGFHDSANAMATSVATGAFKPKVAVLIAAILNFVGATISVEVALTISKGMVDDTLVTPQAVFAGLAGAILWNLVTWLLGLPSSSSHAMFGGLIGAVIASAGLAGVHPGVIVSKILLPALVAPLVAGLASMLATRVAYRVTDHTARHSAAVFRNGQRISASMVAMAHGTSDGQKTMGIITLVLVAGKFQEAGTPPQWWVIVAAALAIALGTYSGGWRIMRTMGKRLVDIQPPQGFAAESSATVAILASAHLGFGLSTTHVASGAIIGSGLGSRAKVNWTIARQMLFAWLLTLPAAGIVGALASLITKTGNLGFGVVMILLAAASVAILVRANQSKVSHDNVVDDEEAPASEELTGLARWRTFGAGHITPIMVIDGIAWTNPGDRVSHEVGMTARAEASEESRTAYGEGDTTMVMVAGEADEDEEETPESDREHTLQMGD